MNRLRNQDLLGRVFGKWTVVSGPMLLPYRDGMATQYWVSCACGKLSRIVRARSLVSGGSKSCGDSQQGRARHVGRPIARLSAADQARFEKLRATLGRKRLAKVLGVGDGAIVKLEGGGYASPEVVARVVAGMGAR